MIHGRSPLLYSRSAVDRLPMQRVLWVAGVFAAFAAAQMPGRTQMTPADRAQPDGGFTALAERFMYESLALSPISASAAGYHVHPDAQTGRPIELDAELDDVSPAGFQRQIAFYRGWQKR